MDTSFYHISEKSVERIAEAAALSVPGVRSLDAKLAGLAGRSFPRVNVHLDRATATAAVEAEIATTYPSPVAAITEAVRATIIAHIRELCGLEVSQVQVTVANVEADPTGHRVTWDDVASHIADVEPVPVRVHPSRVTSPVTEEREPLTPIVVDSDWDSLREVTVPAPLHVDHVQAPAAPEVRPVEAPEPVEPRTTGFWHAPIALAEVSVPPERPVLVPTAPAERDLAPIRVDETQVRAARVPEPVALQPVRIPPQAQLLPVVVENATRVEPVSRPRQRPLKQVLIDRPPLVPISVEPHIPLRHATAPQPQPVAHPVAPTPTPLKQITIQPVEKYYDRTR